MYFCSHLQIFRRNVIACAENVGFSGCFNTSPCFPNSLVVGLAMELRAQRAQNPSEKHVACFKSPGFLCACDLSGGARGGGGEISVFALRRKDLLVDSSKAVWNEAWCRGM